MVHIKTFVLNPFQVNTYVLYDESGEAAVIDPGFSTPGEENELLSFLSAKSLNPVLVINTHAHIDHIMGNQFMFTTFGLKPMMHQAGVPFVQNAAAYGKMFGIQFGETILPDIFLPEEGMISFGNTKLRILHTPGHADGSLCLYHKEQGFVITGDVLFFESIGRTDLPTGNFNTLIESIQQNLLVLDDHVVIWPGHGHESTIGHERNYNPFIRGEG